MEIHLIRPPGRAGRVGRRHVVQGNGRAVRQRDPLPDEQGAALPISHHIVELPISRAPCGIRTVRPVALSRTFSVSCATSIPGRSELSPVIRLAGMILPAVSVQGDAAGRSSFS